jgi:glycosyltransferase involved in cell wall biosynthesis
MDSPPGRFYLRWPLLVLRMLPKLRGADVVVAGSEIDNGLLVSWLAARLLRKPCVVIVHASPRYMMAQWSPRPLRAALRYVLPRCAGAVCVAPELETEMIELGARPERTVTVTNGIDIEDLRARAAQVPITPREHPVVVAVGRMVPQKGFDVLLRAHAQVVSDHPHRLRLVGEGRDAAQLEALAQELGVRDSVEFTGFLDDPVPAMADADVFCLSSRHEGFGLVAFEAQTIGLPVIATDCASAIHDLLGGGAYGDLLPPDDVDALAAALRAYLSDPATLQAKAAAGQAQSERYSLALTAARHAEALARVVGAAS